MSSTIPDHDDHDSRIDTESQPNEDDDEEPQPLTDLIDTPDPDEESGTDETTEQEQSDEASFEAADPDTLSTAQTLRARLAGLIPGQSAGTVPEPTPAPTTKASQWFCDIAGAYSHSPALVRDDGAVIGAIRVEPSNHSFTSDMKTFALGLAMALTSGLPAGGKAMLFDMEHDVDYDTRIEKWNQREQEAADAPPDDFTAALRADIAEERKAVTNLYEETTTERGYYILLEIEEEDAIQAITDPDTGIHSVPLVGAMVTDWKIARSDDVDLRPTQTRILEERLNKLQTELRSLTKSATILPSSKCAQLVADYFNTEDMFAYRDFTSVVRQTPIPGRDSHGDPMVSLSHHERPGSVIANDANGDAYSNQLKTLLGPHRVEDEGATDASCLKVDDDRYTATLAVTGWPDAPDPDLLKSLYEYQNAGVRISTATHIERISDEKASRLSTNAKNSLSQKLETVEGTPMEEYVRQKLQQAEEVSAAQQASPFGAFKVGLTIQVSVPEATRDNRGGVIDGRDYLDSTVSEITTLLKENANLTVERWTDYHREGFKSCAPTVSDDLGQNVILLGEGLGALYPWTRENLTDPGGVEIGVHKELQEPTILNPFQRSTGNNLGIYATIGSGKTITASEIVNRMMQVYGDDILVVIADPLKEYVNLTEMHDGQRRVLGKNTYINPLSLHAVDQSKAEEVGETTPYQDMARRVSEFLRMYYDLENCANIEEKSEVWMRAMHKAVEEETNIDPEDPTTFHHESATLTEVIDHLFKMKNNPHDYLDSRSEGDDQDAEDLAQTAREITLYDIGPFTDGGRFEFLTKQTNIDLEDAGLVYLDYHKFEGDRQAAGLLMNTALPETVGQAKQANEKVILLFDEFHYMLKNNASAQFFEQEFRHSRHWDFSIITATQSISEFFDNEGNLKESSSVLLDLQSMHLLQFIKENRDLIASAIDLNQAERDYLKNATPGEKGNGKADALLRVDEHGSYPLEVKMSDELNPREFALYQYDPTDHENDVSLREWLANYTDEHGRDVCNWRWD